ncbi:MAG: hypothetical protein VX252_01470 [Myxococcota bacterium]|nr:hypothetical protein [Myxococcota bacterium]
MASMPNDFRGLLWVLKLGALVNLYLIAGLFSLAEPDLYVVVPALILLGVSFFRCLFPNRYLENIVFHDTPLSSIFLTRCLATFSEVAYIYQFSYVIRILNVDSVGWVDGLSWLMVVQVVVSQVFVWSAILTQRLRLYFFEEVGWWVIFFANTLASLFLYFSPATPPTGLLLLKLNLFFGLGYLPWQMLHLRSLRKEARAGSESGVDWRTGLRESIRQRQPRTDGAAWGGVIGLTWMVAYWASLIPIWVYTVARVVSGL